MALHPSARASVEAPVRKRADHPGEPESLASAARRKDLLAQMCARRCSTLNLQAVYGQQLIPERAEES